MPGVQHTYVETDALGAGRIGGAGRVVDGLPSARCLRACSIEGEAAIDGSASTVGRIVVGLTLSFEGERAGELFGLVVDDLVALLPDRLRGLECVGVNAAARVSGGRS